ncbi:hypothetical protein [Bacillus paranthracis]|uniref:hypothetical protein n=1 Tax=Bacillus paranthracis TaxID=2026186 RepID=UPI0013D27F99|nr:hypothetical protein [Bacillus paranthracis]
MSKVNVDEIQVGDLVGFEGYKGEILIGYVTNIETKQGCKQFWGHFSSSHNPDRKEFLHDFSVDYHWKVINFEEESKMNDELKVYTGKDTIEALLEGKTLKYSNSNRLIKYENDQFLTKDHENQWRKSLVQANSLLTINFTEVVTPQVGDWVRVTTHCETVIAKIGKVEGNKFYSKWNDIYESALELTNENYTWEILSPEQVSEYKREQAFIKIGRKLNEFKADDIVFVSALGEVAVVISKENSGEFIKVHLINKSDGFKAKPHQLTPISFTEQQVDLS